MGSTTKPLWYVCLHIPESVRNFGVTFRECLGSYSENIYPSLKVWKNKSSLANIKISLNKSGIICKYFTDDKHWSLHKIKSLGDNKCNIIKLVFTQKHEFRLKDNKCKRYQDKIYRSPHKIRKVWKAYRISPGHISWANKNLSTILLSDRQHKIAFLRDCADNR